MEKDKKTLIDYLIPLHTLGKVIVDYDKTGIRFYKDSSGKELSESEVYALLDDELKNPKSFIDAFERSYLLRRL